MAASKSKYQVSVTKLHRLPPIREESMGGRTPRSARRTNSDGFVTTDSKITVQPLNPKPSIHVRPLPGKSRKVQFQPPGPPRSETQILDSYPKTLYRDAPDEPMTNTPPQKINPQKTLVDGLVADYLHYAQYGHIIPVYEGTGTLSCSCCTERNRENVRTMLGFPTNTSGSIPHNSVGYRPMGPNPKPDTWLTGSTKPLISSQKTNQSPRFDELDFDDLSKTPRGNTQGRENWLEYQPKPYASSYANAEFNRPLLVYNHFKEINNDNSKYFSNQVLDANTKYDDAMKKLEKFSFS